MLRLRDIYSDNALVEFHRIQRDDAKHAGVKGEYDATGLLECTPSWADGPFTNFVLMEDNKGVATISVAKVGRHEDVVGLSLVAVDPALRGNGLGRELISQVKERLRHEGVRAIFVNAAHDAVDYYRKCGFTEHVWHPETLQDWPPESGPLPIQMALNLES